MLRHDRMRTRTVWKKSQQDFVLIGVFFSCSMYRKMVEFAKNKAVNSYKFVKFTGKIGDIKTARMTFYVL